MGKVKVLLAGNEELWWEGLAKLLESDENIEVVDICYNAPAAIEKAKKGNLDVILIDEEIPEGDCGETAENICKLKQDTKVIIALQPYKLNINFSSSFRAGATGYIAKDIRLGTLKRVLCHVAKGDVVIISNVVSRALLQHFAAPENIDQDDDVRLSKREREVLLLLSQGMSNREISETLCISVSTVKVHLSSIFEKMKVSNRNQAVALAKEKGTVSTVK